MYILQIGELVAHLPDDFRENHSHIPWRQIKGMRNVFAHDYDNTNLEEAWVTIETDIPALATECRKILHEITEE